MRPFTSLESVAAPLPIANIDTDKILAGRFLKTVTRTGLGKALFDSMRRDANGNDNPDFILNQPPYDRAQILVTHENFGCGSSREHAPWALLDFGIKCIIAPSFADIFFNNCVKNGILAVILARPEVDRILGLISSPCAETVSINLEDQTVRCGTAVFTFMMDAGRKRRLQLGLDEIRMSLERSAEISRYEDDQATRGTAYLIQLSEISGR
jgi:3-isopropylmalate/(R)-2-methylmalate dehydratase small subunit